MDTTYTIGGLAKSADVPVSTIRYYERRGLLDPKYRTHSSYRVYGEESLQCLRFIRAAQGAGFTLGNIAHLLELRAGKADPCGDVRVIVEDRLGQVDEQMKELRRVKRVLKKTLDWCRTQSAPGHCDAIAMLDKQARNPGARAPSRSS